MWKLTTLAMLLFASNCFAQATQNTTIGPFRVAGVKSDSPNSSDGDLSTSFGRIRPNPNQSAIVHQALINWNLNQIPRFSRINSVSLNSNVSGGSFLTNYIEKNWGQGATWNSLGNGLSGSEIGNTVLTNTLRNAVQSHVNDDGVDFRGIVYHFTIISTAFRQLNSSTLTINWTRRIGGDTDVDGDVDFADFVRLANNFGQCNKSWAQGDFTGDGCVQFNDYTILAANWTPVSPPPPAP